MRHIYPSSRLRLHWTRDTFWIEIAHCVACQRDAVYEIKAQFAAGVELYYIMEIAMVVMLANLVYEEDPYQIDAVAIACVI